MESGVLAFSSHRSRLNSKIQLWTKSVWRGTFRFQATFPTRRLLRPEYLSLVRLGLTKWFQYRRFQMQICGLALSPRRDSLEATARLVTRRRIKLSGLNFLAFVPTHRPLRREHSHLFRLAATKRGQHGRYRMLIGFLARSHRRDSLDGRAQGFARCRGSFLLPLIRAVVPTHRPHHREISSVSHVAPTKQGQQGR